MLPFSIESQSSDTAFNVPSISSGTAINSLPSRNQFCRTTNTPSICLDKTHGRSNRNHNDFQTNNNLSELIHHDNEQYNQSYENGIITHHLIEPKHSVECQTISGNDLVLNNSAEGGDSNNFVEEMSGTSSEDPTRDDSNNWHLSNDENVSDEETQKCPASEPPPTSPHSAIKMIPGRSTRNGTINLSGRGLKSINLSNLKESYSDLTTLQSLRLSGNLLSSLPLPLFEPLESLRILDLSYNRLTGLNANLAHCCRYLEELILDYNNLNCLPDSICELHQLRILRCSHNSLHSIPLPIGRTLRKLNVFKISNNSIQNLPPSIGQLRSLETLDISNNLFSTVPSSMHQLTRLKSLTLDWFRYCSPSLPSCQIQSDELKIVDKFRRVCHEFHSNNIVEVDALHMIHALSVKELIISAIDTRGRNRLHVSCSEGHIGVSKSLIAAGAEVNALDKDGLSPLVLAVRERCYAGVKFLLESEASITTGGGLFGSALHVATVNLDVEMCQLLIKNGSDASQLDIDGNSPLHVLMSVYDRNSTKASAVGDLLIEAGANCNALNVDKWSALHLAARRGQKNGITYIIKNNVSAPIQCRRGLCSHRCSAAGLAVKRGQTLQPQSLTSCQNSSLTQTTAVRHTAVTQPFNLQQVASYSDDATEMELDPLDIFLRSEKQCRKTFDLDITGGTHHWTALHLAGHASHVSVVMQLIAAGANVTLRNRNGRTPLQVSRGNLLTSKLLRAAEDEWRILRTQPALRKILKDPSRYNNDFRLSNELSLFHHSIVVSLTPPKTTNGFVLPGGTSALSERSDELKSGKGSSSLSVVIQPSVSAPSLIPGPKRASGDSDDVIPSRDDGLEKKHHNNGLGDHLESIQNIKEGVPRKQGLSEPCPNLHSSCEAIRMMRASSIVSESVSSGFRGLLEFRVASSFPEASTPVENQHTELTVLKLIADRCCEVSYKRLELKKLFEIPLLDHHQSTKRLALLHIPNPKNFHRVSSALLSFFVSHSLPHPCCNFKSHSFYRIASPLTTNDSSHEHHPLSQDIFLPSTCRENCSSVLSTRLEGLRIGLKYNFEDLVRYIIALFGTDSCRLSQFRNSERETFLHLLCQQLELPSTTNKYCQRADLLLFLLQLKNCSWDVNARDLRGLTPLHLATRTGDLNLVQLLLLNGANPNKAEITTGWTALHFAISQRKYHILQQLLYHCEINPDVEDFFKWSPIAEAIAKLDLRSVALLINRGISVPVPIGNIPKQLNGTLNLDDTALSLVGSGRQTLLDVFNIAARDITEDQRQLFEAVLQSNGISGKTHPSDLVCRKKISSYGNDIQFELRRVLKTTTSKELGMRSFNIPEGVALTCLVCSSPLPSAKLKIICRSCSLPLCSSCAILTTISGPFLDELPRHYLYQLSSLHQSQLLKNHYQTNGSISSPQWKTCASQEETNHPSNTDISCIRQLSEKPKSIERQDTYFDDDLRETVNAVVQLNRDVKQLQDRNYVPQQDVSVTKQSSRRLDKKAVELLFRLDNNMFAYGTDVVDWQRIFAGDSNALPMLHRANSRLTCEDLLETNNPNITKRPRLTRQVKLCSSCFHFYCSLP